MSRLSGQVIYTHAHAHAGRAVRHTCQGSQVMDTHAHAHARRAVRHACQGSQVMYTHTHAHARRSVRHTCQGSQVMYTHAHAHARRAVRHTWGLKADKGLSSKLAQTLSKSSGVRVCNTPCAHNTLHNPPATVFAFECIRRRHRKLQHPLLAYEVFSVHEPMVWSIGCTRDNCVVILKSGLKQAAMDVRLSDGTESIGDYQPLLFVFSTGDEPAGREHSTKTTLMA